MPPTFFQAHGIPVTYLTEEVFEVLIVKADRVKRVDLDDPHGEALVIWYNCAIASCLVHHPGFTMAVSLSYC